LIVAGAPVWVIVATALILNLRFVVFSAAMAKGFRNVGTGLRWLCGYLLTDGGFIVTLDKMLSVEDRQWRLGYYLAPSILSWLIWQVFGAIGVFAAASIPKNWSLDFMATIALLVLLVPMARSRPMLVAAATGGVMAVLLRGLPLRLGVIVAIVIGIVAGFLAEAWGVKKAGAEKSA
ncbi:MAG: AzlC family ABC transporter permease, partial [Janthinobacterium lividum]